jgi:hypothetical protein
MSHERVPKTVRSVLQSVLLRLRCMVVPWFFTVPAR